MSIHSKTRYLLQLIHGIVAAVILISNVTVSSAQDTKADDDHEAAVRLVNLGLWEQAAIAYKEYFKEYPRHAKAGHAHYGLGLCYFNMKDYASAAKELQFVAGSKGPDPVRSNLLLGRALMLKVPSVPKGAELALEASLKSMGLSREGLLRGKLFKREWSKKSVAEWLGKTKESEKRLLAAEGVQFMLEATLKQGNLTSVVKRANAFDAIIKGSPFEQGVRILTGEAHEKSKNYKEAAVAYEAAANLKGADASEALFRLGMVRLEYLQNFKEAAKNFSDFSDKYKSDSRGPDASFNEALCYYKSYNNGEKSHFTIAVELLGGFARANSKHKLAEIAQFYAGELQHSRKEWQAAANALEPLMDKKNPAFGQIVFMVADSYHNLQKWDKSAELYMRFAKGNEKALNADVAMLNAGIACSNLKKPDTDGAIAAYQLLEAKRPDSPLLPNARLNLGEVYYRAGQYDEAKKSLQKIPAGHSLWPKAEYYLAWADLHSRKPIEAAKRFKNLRRRLARTSPKNRLIALSNLYQGIAEFEGRRFTESTKTLSAFAADFPSHEKLDEAAFNLGLGQMELGKWDVAIKSFEIVPEKSELHAEALYNAAWSKRSDAKPNESATYYKALLDKHPNSPLADNVALELAEVESETGGEKGAADSVKRLTALLNKKPAPKVQLRRLALWRLGLVQRERKNYLESAKAFEDLLSVGAGDLLIQAAFEAGVARSKFALAAKGERRKLEYKAALKNYEIAVQAEKSDRDAIFQENSLLSSAQCKAHLKLWSDSQKSFELFIESVPKHKLIRTAHLGLGWTLLKQEKYPTAIKSFEQTVADGVRDDTGARAQFLLGECYLEQKQYDKAIIEFAKVEALYKFPQWQSKAALDMAKALLRKGNRDGARNTLERLIKSYPDTNEAADAKIGLEGLN